MKKLLQIGFVISTFALAITIVDMKFLRAVFLMLMLAIISTAFSQLTEIECIVVKKSGEYITVKPAHYDEQTLPKVGDKVILWVYLKDDLPLNKPEQYYDLSFVLITKLIPNLKTVVFKLDNNNIELARHNYGIPNISIDANVKIKISWNSFQ